MSAETARPVDFSYLAGYGGEYSIQFRTGWKLCRAGSLQQERQSKSSMSEAADLPGRRSSIPEAAETARHIRVDCSTTWRAGADHNGGLTNMASRCAMSGRPRATHLSPKRRKTRPASITI